MEQDGFGTTTKEWLMDTGWLQDFMVLADTGNFTRAAQLRNISQAAFSRRIMALESWVGATLVDRGTYPTTLTPEGVRFRKEASDLHGRLLELRSAVSAPEESDQSYVRIAMPHILSMSRFPQWWPHWSAENRLSTALTIGNISEIVPVFLSGGVDVMICHQGDQLPMVPDPQIFEHHVIETEKFQPYVACPVQGRPILAFPGSKKAPVPLISYSRGTYFARLVDIVLEQAPEKLWGRHDIDASMSGVLLNCIAAGLGVGWLPESAVSPIFAKVITPIAMPGWSMNLRVVAYAHRRNRTLGAELLWERLTK
jgi:DNA-binding transcriptional LysR family regulator